jgi:hypothetical protein
MLYPVSDHAQQPHPRNTLRLLRTNQRRNGLRRRHGYALVRLDALADPDSFKRSTCAVASRHTCRGSSIAGPTAPADLRAPFTCNCCYVLKHARAAANRRRSSSPARSAITSRNRLHPALPAVRRDARHSALPPGFPQTGGKQRTIRRIPLNNDLHRISAAQQGARGPATDQQEPAGRVCSSILSPLSSPRRPAAGGR